MAKGDENLKPFDFGSGHPVTAQSAGRGVPGWVIFLLLVLLVLGGGGAYLFYFDRDLGQKLLDKSPIKPPVSVTTAYKWKDAEGNWQITDHPPPGSTPYETLKIRSDANVIPSIPRTDDKSD